MHSFGRIVLAAALTCTAQVGARQIPQPLPTGQTLTALAAPSAHFTPLVTHFGSAPDTIVDGAAAIAVSPDKREMLVLTSGYNRFNGPDGTPDPIQSQQYIFHYRISDQGATLLQSLTVPNSYSGIAWRPDGQGFIVGGGQDDNVHVYARTHHGFEHSGVPIALGHAHGNGVDVLPQAAGVAISADGRRALVANYYNDSITLVDLDTRSVLAEQDLRPGKIDPLARGVAGGEYPFALAWTQADQAWVSSPRDRQLVVLNVGEANLGVTARLPVIGEPTALLFDPNTARLYATEDNADRLAIVDTTKARLIAEPRLGLPDALNPGTPPLPKGLNLNSLALLPNGRLLITYGGANAVAMVTPQSKGARVDGVVPTSWYPSAVATSADGDRVFVVNRKSPPGPSPRSCGAEPTKPGQPVDCDAANQGIFQLEKAGLLDFPMPRAQALARTSRQVARNIGLEDRVQRAAAEKVMAKVRQKIHHVIYILKENRTYDQVLGDLPIGNGDPHLAILGKALSPNHHALALNFVTLDNFYASGEVSNTGWTWVTAGRTIDLNEKNTQPYSGGRGLSFEAENANRNIVPQLSMADRRKVRPTLPDDDDLLPGPALSTAPDGDGDDDDDRGQGYLWDAALRKGLSVRNYGFLTAYKVPLINPVVREPFKDNIPVFVAAARSLATRSDPFFSGSDLRLPDFWREREWEREFAQQEQSGTMPALTLLRIGGDHFGMFKQAIDGVNTVETQMASNDYALGLIVERVAHSKFRDSTLIFVIEDDAQDGADHVDARRSIAFIAGPYVRQRALVSSRYTSISVLRTIETVLGLKPLGLNDAMTAPMADVFDLNQRDWTFHAQASDALRATQLPIPAERFARPIVTAQPMHDAAYWEQAMQGQDFTVDDNLDTEAFNAALWKGLGAGPRPTVRSGMDLRANREGF